MRRSSLLFLVCFFTVAMSQCAAAAKARHFRWEVSNMFWSPDSEEKVVIGINGQFPGPTIRAKAGDTIVVHLKNGLHTEGVVIHWHGIRQIGTPWADGTASISHCAINPEETFTYRFVVDKPGTYFYHGHYGMQRAAGLYGSLIVDVADGEEEPFKYDGELNLLLSDLYHESIYTQMVGLSSNPFRWIGEPQPGTYFYHGHYGMQRAAGLYGSLIVDVAIVRRHELELADAGAAAGGVVGRRLERLFLDTARVLVLRGISAIVNYNTQGGVVHAFIGFLLLLPGVLLIMLSPVADRIPGAAWVWWRRRGERLPELLPRADELV